MASKKKYKYLTTDLEEWQFTFMAEGDEVYYEDETNEESPEYVSGMTRYIHYPVNEANADDNNSGITYGRGVDFANIEPILIVKKLMQTIKVPKNKRDIFDNKKVYGLKHRKAYKFAKEYKDVIGPLSIAQQKKLFESIYPYYMANIIRIAFSPSTLQALNDKTPGYYRPLDWYSIDSKLRTILVDVLYRGDIVPETHQKAFKLFLENKVTDVAKELDNQNSWRDFDAERFRIRKLFIEKGIAEVFKSKYKKEDIENATFVDPKTVLPDRSFTKNLEADNLGISSDQGSLGTRSARYTTSSQTINKELFRRRSTQVRYGVTIGRGYNLSRRNTEVFGGYKGEKRKEIEIYSQLEYIGFTKSQVETTIKANEAVNKIVSRAKIRTLTAEQEKSIKEELNKIPQLTQDQEDKLFELMYPSYEAAVITKMFWVSTMKINSNSLVVWHRLPQKIKTVLVDLQYIGQFNSDQRKILVPLFANTEIPEKQMTANFIQKLKNHKSEIYGYDAHDKRFKKTIVYLEKDGTQPADPMFWIRSFPFVHPLMNIPNRPTPLINSFLASENAVSEFDNFANNKETSFPVLEPAKAFAEAKSIASDIIPSFINVVHKLVKNSHGENAYKLVDVFLPLKSDDQKVIEKALDNSRKIVQLSCDDEWFKKIDKEMNLRYVHNENIKYIKVLHADIDDKGRKVLQLAEKIPDEINFDIEGLDFEIDTSFNLPLNNFSLQGLFGDAVPGIKMNMRSPLLKRHRLSALKSYITENKNIVKIPLEVELIFPTTSKEATFSPGEQLVAKYSSYENTILLQFDVVFKQEGSVWRVYADEGLFLHLPNSEEHYIDFALFTLYMPAREKIVNEEESLKKKDADVIWDLHKKEILFKFQGFEKKDNIKLFFPGGITTASTDDDKATRVKLAFEKIVDDGGDYYFRLNSRGMSFCANVEANPVTLVRRDGGEELRNYVQITPLVEKDKIKSQIKIIDNKIRTALMAAKFKIPGFKQLETGVSLEMRKNTPESYPEVIAKIDWKNGDENLAELELAMLQLKVKYLEMHIKWKMGTNKWDVGATVDGSISFVKDANILPDLNQLKDSLSMDIEGFNLIQLNKPSLKNIGMQSSHPKPLTLTLLDGMFNCTMTHLNIGFDFDVNNKKFSEIELTFDTTDFSFNKPDILSVKISTGKLSIYYINNMFKIKTPNRIGIGVSMGSEFSFEGTVEWKDEKHVQYLAADGEVDIEGFQLKTLVKIGSIRKYNGTKQPSFILYGATPFEMQLYPGVVVKEVGAGIGINNRIKAFDVTNSEALLKRVSTVKPGKLSSWGDVRDNALFVSLVGQAIIAAVPGNGKEISPYVAELVFSLDSNLELFAVGKMWLASSVNYAKDHRDNPAVIGAMVFKPKQKRLGIDMSTQKSPAIESNEQLKKILEKLSIQFAFRLTPSLIDYHLKNVSYSEKFLGVDVLARGHYRVAIYKRSFLVKAGLHITGNLPRREYKQGPGGFSFEGGFDFLVEYGGLLGNKGVIAYGMINLHAHFRVSAFIEIGFSISIKTPWKRYTISWHERFSASMGAQLHLMGAAAIVNANAGFSGNVTISVRVCGYPLRISPSLSINSHVIHDARNRVARFEHKLNEAVKIADQGGSSNRESASFSNHENFIAGDSLFTSLLNDKNSIELPLKQQNNNILEKWIVLQKQSKSSGNYFTTIFLPNDGSSWYTPHIVPKSFEESSLSHSDYFDAFDKNVQYIATGNFNGKDPLLVVDYDYDNVQSKLSVQFDSEPPSEFIDNSPVIIEISDNSEKSRKHYSLWYLNEVDIDSNSKKKFILVANDINDTLPITEEEVQFKVEAIFPKIVHYYHWSLANNQKQFLGRIAKLYGYSHNEKMLSDSQLELNIREQFNKSISTFIDTAMPGEITNIREYIDVEVLQDPRAMYPMRELLTIEDQNLPDDVLPFDFKKIGAEDYKNPSDDRIKKIVEYEESIEKLQKVLRHNANDEDPSEAASSKRAGLVSKLIYDFENNELQNNKLSMKSNHVFPELASSNKVRLSSADETFGFSATCANKLVTNSKDRDQDDVDVTDSEDRYKDDLDFSFIKRESGGIKKIDLYETCIGEIKSAKDTDCPIKCYPFKQGYTHESDTNDASVIVKLPISIDEIYIKDNLLSQINRIRIYRTIGDGEKTLIADHLRLGIEELIDEKIIGDATTYDNILMQEILDKTKKAKNPCLVIAYSDGTKSIKQIDKDYLNRTSDYNSLKLSDELVKTSISKNANVYIADFINKALVNPYIYVDEYKLKNGEFTNPQLKLNPNSKIKYELLASPIDTSEQGNGTGGYRQEWPLNRLYVPKKHNLPTNLSIILTFDNITRDIAKKNDICINILDNDTENYIDLEDGHLEVWVEAISKDKTGFYTEDGIIAKDHNIKEMKTLVSNIDYDVEYSNTLNKIKLDLKKGEHTSSDKLYFNNENNVFSTDYSYKFYVKLPKMHSNQLLPLEHRVCKHNHDRWHKDIRFKIYKRIEFFELEDNNTYFSNEYVYSSVIYKENNRGNFIRTFCNSFGDNLGGVEIFKVDKDTPLFAKRDKIEMLEESKFRESIQHFQDASGWRLFSVMPENTVESNITVAESDSKDENLQKYYINEKSETLEKYRKSVSDFSKILKDNSTWKEIYVMLYNFIVYRMRFEKSSLNINSPLVNDASDYITEEILQLLVGIKTSSSLESFIEEVATIEKNIDDLDLTIEKNVLDRKYTRLLLGIIHRRLAIVQELVSITSLDDLPTLGLDFQSRELWPNGNKLEIIAANKYEIYPEAVLVNFNSVLELLMRPHDLNDRKQRINAIKNGSSTVNSSKKPNLSSLKAMLYGELTAEHSYPEALSKVVPIANNLSRIIDIMSNKPDGSHDDDKKIIKFSHHAVNVNVASNKPFKGMTIPKTMNLFSMSSLSGIIKLPDIEDKTDSANQVRGQVFMSLFNLFDYLGFSVDVSIKLSNGNYMHQDKIVKEFVNACNKDHKRNNEDFYYLVLRGISPHFNWQIDNNNLDSLIGYNFVKIAAIPKKIIDKIIKAKTNADEIKHILSHRGIEVTKEDEKLLNLYSNIIEKSLELHINKLVNIYLQPNHNSMASIPLVTNQTNATWMVPDSSGHRFQIAVRKISRYEAIINWYKGLKGDALVDYREIRDNSHEVHVRPFYDDNAMLRINETINLFSVQDESGKAKFLYNESSASSSSLLNDISAVRYGHKGTNHVYNYKLIDRKGEKALTKVMTNIKDSQVAIYKKLNTYILQEPYSINPSPQIYERYQELVHTPHYYRYSMELNDVFDTADEKLPGERRYAETEVEIKQETTYTPSIERTNTEHDKGFDIARYKVQIPLTRNMDLSNYETIDNGPPAIVVDYVIDDKDKQIDAKYIPDLFMEYQIFWCIKGDVENEAKEYYVPVCKIILPWSDTYNPKKGKSPRFVGQPIIVETLPLNEIRVPKQAEASEVMDDKNLKSNEYIISEKTIYYDGGEAGNKEIVYGIESYADITQNANMFAVNFEIDAFYLSEDQKSIIYTDKEQDWKNFHILASRKGRNFGKVKFRYNGASSDVGEDISDD